MIDGSRQDENFVTGQVGDLLLVATLHGHLQGGLQRLKIANSSNRLLSTSCSRARSFCSSSKRALYCIWSASRSFWRITRISSSMSMSL